MSANIIRCGGCGTELKQNEEQCPECGSATKVYEVNVSDGLLIRNGLGIKRRRKGIKRPLAEIKSGWKASGDPKLKDGVIENMVVDREKDEYHHILRDAKTGEITHEEHEKLTEHNKKEVE